MISGDERTLQPFRLPAKVLALTMLWVAATALAVNLVHTFSADFVSYWAAARLALSGNAAGAYDIAVHRAVELEAASFEGLMPFPYPPLFLLVLLPFALLPYVAGATLWTVVTFTGYWTIARRLLPQSGWVAAAFPPVLVNAIIGQNAFLTAGLFIGGFLLLSKRPFVAGMVLGCLVVKPQIGLLLPLAFIAGREWRAFAGAALSSAGLMLLGLLVFGPAAHLAWIGQAPLFGRIAAEGLVGWHKMATVYASLRLAGADAVVAWTCHILVASVAIAWMWIVWRKGTDLGAKLAVLAAATALISPYLYIYDLVFLLPAFFWLATTGRSRHLLAILWCIPLVGLAQSWGFNDTMNLTPLTPIGLLILLYLELRGDRRADASETGAVPRRAAFGWSGAGDQAVR